MKNEKIILALLIISSVVSGLLFSYTLLKRSDMPFLVNLDESPTEMMEPIILMGDYQGDHFFYRDAVIPEGNNVTLRNGEFYGASIRVYGNLTVRNCVFDHDIFLLNNSDSNFKNATFRYASHIQCHDYSNTDIESIHYYNNITSNMAELLITFDHSQVIVNNTIISSKSYGYSVVNFSNIKNFTDQQSLIIVYEQSNVEIIDSDVFSIYLADGFHEYEINKPNFTIKTTNINIMMAYANSTAYLLDFSNVSLYYGWTNSILYNSSTTNISEYYLFDSAQIISI